VSGNTGVYGGGVVIGSGGVFTMKGGMVSDNATVMEDGYGGLGGGVFAGSGSSFTMEGGTIGGNTADYGGGVYARGSFTMAGGTIGGNTAGSDGGGLLCDSTAGGIFVKSGGTIDSANRAPSGRAVYMWDGRNRSIRNAAAGPGVNMDSRKPGRPGGWEAR
jgi:hypothetical protein